MPTGFRQGGWRQCWLLWRLQVLQTIVELAQGDISFPTFVRDPLGHNQHLYLVGGARVDYFSTEFDELCPEVNATAIEPPAGITQRFQHPQFREDPHYRDLRTQTYLDEDQLDNPFAGEISFGNYTQSIESVEFVSDGDLLPLPHNRTQLCHYAIRLTPPRRSKNSATWYRFKQNIVYGFEAEFHFQILHRKQECLAAGHSSDWCQESGADGFAFVIQNEDRKALGTQVSGLGYGFKNCFAIEFDTKRDEDFGETKKNHVSVHVPPTRDDSNSGMHPDYEVAYSDDIPNLQEGTHVVQVYYDVKNYRWDSLLGGTFNFDMSSERLRNDAFGSTGTGRPGLLTVWLDGAKIISLPIDLVGVVNPDPTFTAQADPPQYPDTRAYREAPGKAWIGFTSSTTYFDWQSVDILSWTYKEQVNCPNEKIMEGRAGWKRQPVEYPVEVECRLDDGILGRSEGCTWNGSQFCAIEVQNAARIPITFQAAYRFDVPFLPTTCDNGLLQWDHMHPYFLGCSRVVKFTHDLSELWITSLDNVRQLVIDNNGLVNQHILQKYPMQFKRRSMVKYCVTEHPRDFSRLQLAECNCEYCIRMHSISDSYAMFNAQKCTERFGLECPCYEVSEMEHDASAWQFLEPMKFMRLHTCRGCSYSSQCASMLTVAYCETAYQPYFVGNPLAPHLLDNGFQNLLRDNGRVLDGQIRGDACECEPDLKAYSDPSGRSGWCHPDGELDRGVMPDIAGCANMCKNTAKCEIFVTYPDGTCILYSTCDWVFCKTDLCFSASVWRLQALGEYVNVRGDPLLFKVYPRRTVQSTVTECFDCLHLYEDEFCKAQCGPERNVTYLQWPHGQKCSNCMFAGNRMHEMTMAQSKKVKDCVKNAIRNGEDPWVSCDETAMREAGASALDLFNGVVTHFMTECPGRVMPDGGAVCAPNLHVTQLEKAHLPSQILSRMAAINNTVWALGMDCLNAVCDLVRKSECYERLLIFELQLNTNDFNNRVFGIEYPSFPKPTIRGSATPHSHLMLYKQQEQYVVSTPIPYALENTTMEVWLQVSTDELVTNIAANMNVTANSLWRDDYEYTYANDGDRATYWSSQVGTRGVFSSVTATWTVELQSYGSLYAGGIDIYWNQPAADFIIYGSVDQDTWKELVSVVGNEADTTKFKVYFQARYLKIDMLVAAATRPRGPEYLNPVYSLREVEVLLDDNLARLRPTNVSFRYHRPAAYFNDGNVSSFWASPPGVESMWLFLDLGELTHNIQIVKIIWRFLPNRFKLFRAEEACTNTEALTLEDLTYIQGFVGSQVLPEFLLAEYWSARCIAIWIEETGSTYGMPLTGLSEIEVYTEAQNLVETVFAKLVSRSPAFSEGNGIGTVEYPAGVSNDVYNAMDGQPETFWLIQPGPQPISLLVDLGSVKHVMSIAVRFAIVDNMAYKASRFSVRGGLVDNPEEMATLDAVSGYSFSVRRFVVYEYLQYIYLEVTQIFGTNPDGRLAIEDLMAYEVSGNKATRRIENGDDFDAIASATASWTACEECYDRFPGGTIDDPSYLHAAEYAVDGDLDSWFGFPYGIQRAGDGVLTIHLTEPQDMNLVVIRWQFPSKEVTIVCYEFWSSIKGRAVGRMLDNTDYLSVIPLVGTQSCERVNVVFGEPAEKVGGKGVIGIKELEISKYADNSALNVPAVVSPVTPDLDLAFDSSVSTKWASQNTNPVNVTVDLQSEVSSWGMRLLFPSNAIANEFRIEVSTQDVQQMDDLTESDWELLDAQFDNIVREVFIIKFFTARYIRLRMTGTLGLFFSIRAFQVYPMGSNLVFNAHVQSPTGWNHSGYETVDGNRSTFWISEPLSTEARLSIDLEQVIFVAGGIFVEFVEGYHAVDFDIWVGDNLSALYYLEGVRGNNEVNTSHRKIFEARFVELRLLRPSAENGGGLYSIITFDVFFEPNLAIGKFANATHTIGPNGFIEQHSMDGDRYSIWTPNQATDESRLVFDLEFDTLLSGFDIYWRNPPVEFAVERLHPNGTWLEVVRYKTGRWAKHLEWEQKYPDGFALRKLALQIYETYLDTQGKLVALREVVFHYPGRNNLILFYPKNKINVSHEELFGNQRDTVVNGMERKDYWQPGWGIRAAWLMITMPTDSEGMGTWVGRVRIFWRHSPNTYRVLFQDGDANRPWVTVWQESGAVNLAETQITMMRQAKYINISIDYTETEIGIFQINVYDFRTGSPTKVEERLDPFSSDPSQIIDRSNLTYWMAPVGMDSVYVDIDLFKIYMVYDIEIWFGFEPNGFFTYISTDGENWERQLMDGFSDERGRYHLRSVGFEFPLRYVKILLRKSYREMNNEKSYGSSIREVAVYRFRNLARNKTAWASSIWEYSPNWATDGNPETYWLSKWDTEIGYLDVDLGQVRNVAGMQFLFGYGAAWIRVLVSMDMDEWTEVYEKTGNKDVFLNVSSKEPHFRARYVRLRMEQAWDFIYHPDEWNNMNYFGPVYSVKEIFLYEHTGGGGVVGIQSLDGRQWSTLTYGMRQPGQWLLSTERDSLTQSIEGRDEELDDDFPVGTTYHFVITFRTVGRHKSGLYIDQEIALYRNGIPYGDPYVVKNVDHRRLSQFNKTRVIIGARTTFGAEGHSDAFFDWDSYQALKTREQQEPWYGIQHGDTHSQFFSGKIFNITILKNALSPEEVRGLYAAKAVPGGKELKCHCFDACPTGPNHYFPGLPVPCSGQGICIRNESIRCDTASCDYYTGNCQCVEGFSGENCANHCSELSEYGCCEVDDDCPHAYFCDERTKACTAM